MNNQRIHAVAVGAANIDVHGFTDRPLVMRDSNPGRIRTCPGGVARNIAENLARLGVPVDLITALGDDAGGASLRASCRALGIRLDRGVEVPGHPSSTYMAIMDEEGDMAIGLSDMRILDHVTPEHLESCAPLLSEAGVVVAGRLSDRRDHGAAGGRPVREGLHRPPSPSASAGGWSAFSVVSTASR